MLNMSLVKHSVTLPSFVVKRVKICVVGCQRSGEIKTGLISVVPEGWLSLTLPDAGEQQQEHRIVER